MKCRQSRISHSLVIVSLLFVTLGLSQVGCKKKKSSEGSSGGGLQQQLPLDFTGVWHGTSSQGKPVDFTVVGNNVVTSTVSLSLSGRYCYWTGTTNITSSIGIQNNSFAFNSTDIQLNGSFSGATSSTGNYFENDSYCVGVTSVTWTASKISSSSAFDLSAKNSQSLFSGQVPVITKNHQ